MPLVPRQAEYHSHKQGISVENDLLSFFENQLHSDLGHIQAQTSLSPLKSTLEFLLDYEPHVSQQFCQQ